MMTINPQKLIGNRDTGELRLPRKRTANPGTRRMVDIFKLQLVHTQLAIFDVRSGVMNLESVPLV